MYFDNNLPTLVYVLYVIVQTRMHLNEVNIL